MDHAVIVVIFELVKLPFAVDLHVEGVLPRAFVTFNLVCLLTSIIHLFKQCLVLSELLQLCEYFGICECFIFQVQSLVLGVEVHDIHLGQWLVKILTQLASDLNPLFLWHFASLCIFRRLTTCAALVGFVCHWSPRPLEAELVSCMRQVHSLVCMRFRGAISGSTALVRVTLQIHGRYFLATSIFLRSAWQQRGLHLHIKMLRVRLDGAWIDARNYWLVYGIAQRRSCFG